MSHRWARWGVHRSWPLAARFADRWNQMGTQPACCPIESIGVPKVGRGRLLLWTWTWTWAEVEEQSCNVLDPEMRKSHPAESYADAEESECDPDSVTAPTNQSQFGKLLEKGCPCWSDAKLPGGVWSAGVPPTRIRIESATGRDKTIFVCCPKVAAAIESFLFSICISKRKGNQIVRNCSKLFGIAFAFTQNNDGDPLHRTEIIGHSTLGSKIDVRQVQAVGATERR